MKLVLFDALGRRLEFEGEGASVTGPHLAQVSIVDPTEESTDFGSLDLDEARALVAFLSLLIQNHERRSTVAGRAT